MANFDLININQRNLIELEGISGVFNSPSSNFQVRFFSTYANSNENNYSQLLDELKPMRERVTINTIKSISQVLQRDLDDFRIANGLVPYLLNLVNNISNNNHIAFFPAILGVIIPKDYISNNIHNTVYPTCSTSEDNKEFVLEYKSEAEAEFSWQLKHLKASNGRRSPFSILTLDRDESEIIVLDGQHRANAFRVASQKFFTNPYNNIYEPYYNKSLVYPENFKTDLPVTLIWFEKLNSKSEIVPEFITRRIFIDVNNNAKSISPSRQILLDDRDPSSILTNSFFSIVADKYGFSTTSDKLSLIHLGFDMNTELRDRRKSMSLNISNPETLNVAFDWFFFGSRNYNALNVYNVSNERKLKFNSPVLSELLPITRKHFTLASNEEGEDIKTIKDPEFKDEVFQEFLGSFFDPFYKIFNDFNLLTYHYKATSAIQYARDNHWSSPTMKDVWDEIFIGGEGLYYSFQKLYDFDSKRKDLKDTKDAIDAIEEEFRTIRAKLISVDRDTSDSAFNGFSSVAFQVGLLMAFYDYCKHVQCDFSEAESILNTANDFVDRLNSVKVSVWCKALSEVKKYLVEGDIDPKKWPMYQNLILRLIQKGDEFFNKPTYYNCSPEAQIYNLKFKKAFKGFYESKFSEDQKQELGFDDFISDYAAEVKSWKNISVSETEYIFENYLDIKPNKLMPYDADSLAENIIKSKIK